MDIAGNDDDPSAQLLCLQGLQYLITIHDRHGEIEKYQIAVRLAAKAVGVGLGNVGSGASWRQALWVGCAMTPMSSIALLIASQFVVASPSTGHLIARVALPAILLMEVLGAVIATVAIYRAGESSKPWAPLSRGGNGDRSES